MRPFLGRAKVRQKLFAVDMIENSETGMGGPWNRANFSLLYNGGGDDYRNYLIRRFDLKMRWTGREKLALRSIALRDTLAQLLFGDDQAGINCNTGAGECPNGQPAAMKYVAPSEADEAERKTILEQVVLKKWAARCTAECVEEWNQTVGKVVGVAASR